MTSTRYVLYMMCGAWCMVCSTHGAWGVPVSAQTLDMEEWHMTTHSSRALVNYPKNRYINIVPCECCGRVLWVCAGGVW